MAKTKEQKLIGKTIRIKNGDDDHGIVRHVIGEGRTAHYEVRTMSGIVWLFRDQFTLPRR